MDVVGTRDEDRVDATLKPRPDICSQVLISVNTSMHLQWFQATYINGADEIGWLRHDMRPEKARKNGSKPSTNKTFNSLFGWQLNEWGSSKKHTKDISKDVVGDDKSHRQEKPDHALEDIVHDKVRLYDNQGQSHVRPSKLSELEFVVAFLKWHNEEDKPNKVEDQADESMMRGER